MKRRRSGNGTAAAKKQQQQQDEDDDAATVQRVRRALHAGIAALRVTGLRHSGDLLCRDAHTQAIRAFLRSTTCLTMQIFGMPGTGKTATVQHALTQLAAEAAHKDAVDTSDDAAQRVTSVVLNGYVVQKATDMYWTLYRHLCRVRLGSEQACALERCASNLEARFRHGWGSSTASSSSSSCGLCVIVVDEVDKVLERHPKCLFKIIDWLTLPHAHCKLLTISNSMELAIDAKTRSRLDATQQLVFLPYNTQELKAIFAHRTRDIAPRLFAEQAVNLLCHQTASQYGDVRRLLQAASAAICSVRMRLDEGTYALPPCARTATATHDGDGIVTVRDVHGVVRQIFHDRFVEFVKTVRSPVVYVVIAVLARETARLYASERGGEADCRLPVERVLALVRDVQQHLSPPPLRLLSRAALADVLDMLRQVALIDLSVGDDRVPVHSPDALLTSSEDAYASLLQSFQTITDSCRLHDTFGSSIGALLF